MIDEYENLDEYFENTDGLDEIIDDQLDDIIDNDDPHILTEDYDDDELARRKTAYTELKRNDKIFNNTYTMGYESDEYDDSEFICSGSSEIKLESGSREYELYASSNTTDHLDYDIIQRDIDEYIKASPEVQDILGNDPDTKKFNKSEINLLFNLIYSNFCLTSYSSNNFVSGIYILDSISSITNIDYKKLFDQLEYENKEILILELNSKYEFLDNINKNFKMFE